MDFTFKNLIKSINKLSSSYYELAKFSATTKGIDKETFIRNYFNQAISETGKTLQFLNNFPFEINPVAKLSIYYLYESLKLLLEKGEGLSETESLISYIREQLLKSGESEGGYSLFDAKKSNQNKELFAIQQLMDNYLSNTKTLQAIKLLHGEEAASKKSPILNDIAAQLSSKEAPEGLVSLQTSMPKITWQEYTDKLGSEQLQAGAAFSINMELTGIGVTLNDMAAELASSSEMAEGGGKLKLNVSTFGRAVKSIITKSERCEEVQNAIINDYERKLKEVSDLIVSGTLPIQLVRQTREKKQILEKLIEASKKLKELIISELIPISKEEFELYEKNEKVKTFEPEYLASEKGKKESQEILSAFEAKLAEHRAIYDKVCTAYHRVRYFKYQLDIVEASTIRPSQYKSILEGLSNQNIEYVDEDGNKVIRPGSLEDITKIQEINRAIVADRKDYHLRGKSRVRLVSLMTYLFNRLSASEITEDGFKTIAELMGTIYTIEQKALSESKVKRKENIEAKRKVEVEAYKLREQYHEGKGNVSLLEFIANEVKIFMQKLGGNRDSKARQSLSELEKMFKNPSSFLPLVSEFEKTEARDLFVNLRIRVLVELFRRSQDPQHQQIIKQHAADTQDARRALAESAEFKKFVLDCQSDLSKISEIDNEAFGKLIKQTFDIALTKFVREIFSNPRLAEITVNANKKLATLRKQLFAFDATSSFIDDNISTQYFKLKEKLPKEKQKEFLQKYTKEKAESLKSKLEEAKTISEPTDSEAFIGKLTQLVKLTDDYISSFTTTTPISPKSVETEIDTELSEIPTAPKSEDTLTMLSLLEGMYDLPVEDIRSFVESEDFATIASNESPEIKQAAMELTKILEDLDILSSAENWDEFQKEEFLQSQDYKNLLKSKSENVRELAKKLKY